MDYSKYKKAELIELLISRDRTLRDLKDSINETVIDIIEDVGICNDARNYIKDFYDTCGLEHPSREVQIEAQVSLLEHDEFSEDDIEISINHDYLDTFDVIIN